MNPRLYLRLLQPAHALLLVIVYTGFAALVNCRIFGFAWPREAMFATAAVTLPALLGGTVTASLHAALHRPFALLLPDLLPRLRRAAALTYLGLAAVVTLTTAFIEPAAPPPALFGLALGLLTLNCANRHQTGQRPGFLSGLPAVLLIAVAWVGFHLTAAHHLLPALQAAPWVFFLGGTALGATLFTRGFSRRLLRERALTPYFAPATSSATFDNLSVFRRQLRERAQSVAVHRVSAAPSSRASPLPVVGSGLRDWLHVLDHQRRGPAMRWQLWTFAGVGVGVALNLAIFAVLGLTGSHGIDHLADLFAILSGLTADLTGTPNRYPATMTTLGVLVPVLVTLLAGLGFSRPLLVYPLARARLAQLVFAHTVRHLLRGLLLPGVALWVFSLIGQAVTSRFQPLLGLPSVALIGLTLAPFLPLLALKVYADRTLPPDLLQRSFGFLVSIGAALAVTVVQHEWRSLILSPAGLLASVLATAFTLWILRRRIRRHYLSCDLTRESAWPVSLGVP